MAILGLAPLVAIRLIDAGTVSGRLAGVLVGVGSALPWMAAVALIIRRGDEFQRRVHLVALAWSFGGSMVLLVAIGWLVRADFLAPPDFFVVWLGLLVIWFLAIVLTRRRFERGA